MSLYIANPRNAEAVALLNKYSGMRPYLQSIEGPAGGVVWAAFSTVIGLLLLILGQPGWAALCGLSMICGAVWATLEYEPGRRHHVRQFDELVANGQIVCVSREVEEAIHKRLQKSKWPYSVEEMLAYCYVDLSAFQSGLNEVRAQGSLDKAGERYVTGKIRDFIDQCVVTYRQHLAEKKTHETTEQSIRTDWTKKRL